MLLIIISGDRGILSCPRVVIHIKMLFSSTCDFIKIWLQPDETKVLNYIPPTKTEKLSKCRHHPGINRRMKIRNPLWFARSYRENSSHPSKKCPFETMRIHKHWRYQVASTCPPQFGISAVQLVRSVLQSSERLFPCWYSCFSIFTYWRHMWNVPSEFEYILFIIEISKLFWITREA